MLSFVGLISSRRIPAQPGSLQAHLKEMSANLLVSLSPHPKVRSAVPETFLTTICLICSESSNTGVMYCCHTSVPRELH